jgi:hypothetical protein
VSQVAYGKLHLLRISFLALGVICSHLAAETRPAIAQTSGGSGGAGGAVNVYVYGNNTGTINAGGGSGGAGGNAAGNVGTTPGSTLAPSARAVRVVTFVITNRASYTQQLKFFSQRNVWPGSDRAYVLNTRAPTPFRLSCEPGERICYGAFYRNNSTSWGAGQYGEKSCASCCLVCQADREVVYSYSLGDG